MAISINKKPEEYMIWAIAFFIGCVFLYCLPKIILVVAVAGLTLGVISSTKGVSNA